MSISLLRKLLMKEAVKDTAGSSGIMSINKNIAAKVDQQVQRYVNDAMRQGVDLDTLSPEQLKMIVQINKPKPPRVIAGDSPEGKGIMEALLGKRGEVVDFPQKRSFKQEVDDMIKDGTITKGARGMKKSKKVQDREMFQGANKRLKTDVNKIIADIKSMDPMDSMKEANSVIGRKGPYKNLTPEESKKILQDTEDHIFERNIPEDPEDFADGGVAGLLGERTGFKGGGMDASKSDFGKSKSTNRERGIMSRGKGPKGTTGNINNTGGGGGNNNTGGGGGGGPPGTNTGGGGPSTTTPTFTQPTILETIKEKQILDYIRTLQEEEDLALGVGGLGPKVLSGIFKAGKGIKPYRKGTDIGIKYETLDKPFNTDFFKFKGGVNLEDTIKGAYETGDIKLKPQIGIEGSKGGVNYGITYDKDGNAKFNLFKKFADGGPARQNFAMGKRAFLKMLAGAGAGIAGLKSGLIGFGGKGAAKKAVTETVKSAGSGTPPPYFFRLVEKIKFMGDDTLATTDKAIAKKYKDYTMEEDFAGNIEIIKKGDNVAEDVYISYKVDDVPLRGKKGSKRIEEYEEYTARPDAEGKMKDIEQGVPDEVIDEAGDTTAMTLKRASGGIARMLGE